MRPSAEAVGYRADVEADLRVSLARRWPERERKTIPSTLPMRYVGTRPSLSETGLTRFAPTWQKSPYGEQDARGLEREALVGGVRYQMNEHAREGVRHGQERAQEEEKREVVIWRLTAHRRMETVVSALLHPAGPERRSVGDGALVRWVVPVKNDADGEYDEQNVTPASAR